MLNYRSRSSGGSCVIDRERREKSPVSIFIFFTSMQNATEPDLTRLIGTIIFTRVIFCHDCVTILDKGLLFSTFILCCLPHCFLITSVTIISRSISLCFRICYEVFRKNMIHLGGMKKTYSLFKTQNGTISGKLSQNQFLKTKIKRCSHTFRRR